VVDGTLSQGGSSVWTAASLTNLSQLTNGPGYITSSALSGYAPLGGAGTSGTWSINITGNAGTATTATSASSAVKLGGNTTGLSDLNTALVGAQADAYFQTYGSVATNKPVSMDNANGLMTWITHPTGGSGLYGRQIAFANEVDSIYTRNISNGSFSGWSRFLTSTNFTTYAPSVTGSGASGTWSINITGGASTVGGYAPSASASANTLVLRDGSNYSYFNYINSNTGNSENPTVSQVIVTNGSDNFYRKASVSHLTSSLSGTAPINISGTAANTSSISSAVGSSYTWTGNQNFSGTSSVGTNGQSGSLAAYSTGGLAATMSFHRAGAYAINMGLDTDNVFRIGGWSDGLNVYRAQFYAGGSLRIAGAFYPSNSSTNYLNGVTSTYGALDVGGSNNGYTGLNLVNGSGTVIGMYDSAGNGGTYDTTTGWQTYFLRSNGCTGIGGSNTVAGYKLNVNGSARFEGAMVATGESYSTSARINSSSPTLNMQDTDHVGAFLHVNSGLVYFLRANAVNGGTWDSGPNGRHPMIMNLSSGSVEFSGDVTAFSDIRLKKNIVQIENALEKVETLRGVVFDHIEHGRGTGLIAQELQEVLPEAVHESADNGYLTVAYGNTVGLLVEAIKELSAQNKALMARLEALEAK
jgi:hypothetical protein